jgi:competence protein ComEC
MRRPFLALAAAFAAGTILAEHAAAGAWVVAALAACLLALAPRAGAGGGTAAVLAAAAGLGAVAASVVRLEQRGAPLGAWAAQEAAACGPVELTGAAVRDVLPGRPPWPILLDVERVACRGVERALAGRARLLVYGSLPAPEVPAGDRLSLWASVRLPSGLANPFASSLPADSGFHVAGWCKSGALVRALPGGPNLRNLAGRGRAWARRVLADHVVAGPEQGVVRAMVIGDRTGVDDETAEDFRRAGTYHVLAISGAQVALVAVVLLRLARPLGPVPAALGVAFAIAGYAVFVGGDPPIARAAVMAVVALVGRAFDLEADLPNLLGLAATALLALDPLAVGDVSFQLSFAATLGLVALTPRLLPALPRLPMGLGLGLAGSLAAQLPLLPLLALHFHRLAPAALLLNLLAVPLAAAVLLAGASTLVAALLMPAVAPLCGDAAWLAAHALLASGRVLRGLPAADLWVPDPPLAAWALVGAGLLGLARGVGGRAWALVGAGLACLLLRPAEPLPEGRLELTLLDVGQGDAMVLRAADGRAWVVDAGASFAGGFDAGEDVVARFLWARGVRRLEGIAVSHGHPDHDGGVPFLIRAFQPKVLWQGPAAPGASAVGRAAARVGVPRATLSRGDRLASGPLRAQVLGPPPGPPAREHNDDSLVLGIEWGAARLLLTGDLETEGEARLPPWPAAVVKVPHHGSRTSSSAAFVAATRPRLALVSVGARNRFGHPDPHALGRYRKAGALVLRTDQDGAVTVSVDPDAIRVRTERSGLRLELR